MKFVKTPLKGSFVVEVEPCQDGRGVFARTFCRKEFANIGFYKQIVQINHSITRQEGSIRGMHYQRPPACETKIIRCVRGRAFDVMVDLREGSPTFMQWHGVELSKDNMRMVFIPEGFAHGFQALTDNVELIYHHSEEYSPECERGLRYDDPRLAIKWPMEAGVVSPRDQVHPLIDESFRGIQI